MPGRERNLVLRLEQLPCPEVKSYLVCKVRFTCELLRVHTDCWREERFYSVQSQGFCCILKIGFLCIFLG